MVNVSKLFENAAKVKISDSQSKTSLGNSKPSLGIICSKRNGKRCHLSKALMSMLSIENYIEMKPSDENTLLVGKNLGIPGVISGEVKNDAGRGIMYNTKCVLTLINYFQLNFENGRTSRSFDKITLSKAPNGEPVAIIIMNGNGELPELEESEKIAVSDVE